MRNLLKVFNKDCLEGMLDIPDESIDVILTDPPYLYLKNQKLDRAFDEKLFFSECKRVLKKDGFIVLFGRGTSFYRWNTMLADLGFTFKEEIVWNKVQSTSPLMSISRIHETISIHTKGNGVINRTKIPYLEAKKHNINSIIVDMKRLFTMFKNWQSLEKVLKFLETNIAEYNEPKTYGHRISEAGDHATVDRCVAIASAMEVGCNEKSIIRSDRIACDTFTKFGVSADKRKKGDRCVDISQSVEFGLNEKTIIEQNRENFSSIHPTQKPVRLLERLLALVSVEGDTVLDPFAGSFSTGVACHNLNRKFIGFEIDSEFFEAGKQRLEGLYSEQERMFNIT